MDDQNDPQVNDGSNQQKNKNNKLSKINSVLAKIKSFKSINNGRLWTRQRVIALIIIAITGAVVLFVSFAATPGSVIAISPNEQNVRKLTNLLLQQTQDIHKYKNSSTASAQLHDTLIQRTGLMKKLVSEEPAAALRVALSDKVRKRIPLTSDSDLEQQFTVSGDLQILIEESKDPIAPKGTTFSITTGAGVINIHPTDPSVLEKFANKHINLTGIKIDSDMAVSTDNLTSATVASNNTVKNVMGSATIASVTAANPVTPIASSVTSACPTSGPVLADGTICVLEIVPMQPDQPTNTISADDVRNVIFKDPYVESSDNSTLYWGSMTEFYKQNTNGKMKITGDVAVGKLSKFECYNNTSRAQMLSDSNAIASALGINVSKYQKIELAHPSNYIPSGTTYVGGCEWSGTSTDGAFGVWASLVFCDGQQGINYYGSKERCQAGRKEESLSSLGHELGHSFGLSHIAERRCIRSATDFTSLPAFTGACAEAEIQYATTWPTSPSLTKICGDCGSYFDQMGWYSNPRHFLAINMEKLGAYTAGQLKLLETKPTGQYHINFATQPAANTTMALKIPRVGTTDFLYVEARKFEKFDRYFNTQGTGVVVTHRNTSTTYPAAFDDGTDAGDSHRAQQLVKEGKTFTDQGVSGNVIRVDSIDATGVNVSLNPSGPVQTCTRNAPNLTISPQGPWGIPGETLTYTASVKNNDSLSCPATNFNINASGVPTGITQSPTLPSLSVAPQATGTVSFTLTSSASIAPNMYTLSETATNMASGQNSSGFLINYNVTNPQPPTSPDMIVTKVTMTPASPATGNQVVFTAEVKNIGNGATPAGTINGVGFFIDGINDTNKVNWSDTNTTSIQPGAVATLTANGGINNNNYWNAIAGSHTVYAKIDDVNRYAESNETNNTLSTAFTVNGASTAGLNAQYFNGQTLSGNAIITRTDNQINNDWQYAGPSASLTDNFSVRWTGGINAPVAGNYIIKTKSDDGIRVWVNGVVAINNWTNHGPIIDASQPISLKAGYNSLKVEYYEGASYSIAQLMWTGPTGSNITDQIIPTSALTTTFNEKLPDFVVTDITYTPATIANGNQTVFSVTIKNQGTGDTTAGVLSGIGIFIDDKQVTWAGSWDAIKAGYSVTVKANDLWTATTGPHKVKAWVDDANRYGETNKTNNILEKSFTVY